MINVLIGFVLFAPATLVTLIIFNDGIKAMVGSWK